MNNNKQISDLLIKINRLIFHIKKNNIIIAGIDPGVNIGIAVFSVTDVLKSKTAKIKNLFTIQKNFAKEFDVLDQDIRIYKISSLVDEILTKYRVDIVVFEKSNYSVGRFSYSENLLARYTGSIYNTIRSLNKYIISINYRTMQKILLNRSTYNKDKAAILDVVRKIYTSDIKKSQYDKLDAIGYAYSFYLLIKLYYQVNYNNLRD